MTRRIGMRASPTMGQRLPTMSASMTRAIVCAIFVVMIVIASAYIATARADAEPCTIDDPLAPFSSVCTGLGQWCTIGIQCSPVPGEKGTQNPDGYTPRCDTSMACPWSTK